MAYEISDPRWCDQHIYDYHYYGWVCRKCGLFFPFGCAPWDEGFEMGESDGPYDWDYDE